MRRLVVVALAALAALAVLLAALVPAAGAAPGKTPSRAKVVCVKKAVKTKSGRKVRRKVCRPRRGAAARKVVAPLSPGPVATTQPATPGAAPLVDATPAPAPTTTGPQPPAAACVPESSEWLTATALDVNQNFVLRLSRTCLRAGRTIVQYQNHDAQEHDLWVEGTSPATARRQVVGRIAGETMAQADMHLTAGEWRLLCAIAGHGNMTRTITVTP